ncbi:hypothetical protein ACFXTI_027984 [Malus domestica]
MSKQRRKDQVIAVRFLIKKLLVYVRERKQEKESLTEEQEEEASSNQNRDKEEFFGNEVEAAIQMVECIYDLDRPEDLPESPEFVEFLCARPYKPPPEVQDHLETIDLGTKQISSLLEVEDRARIVSLLCEFKDFFAWHYTEIPGLYSTLVEHRMPIKEGCKPVKQASRRMSKEIEEKVKEEI